MLLNLGCGSKTSNHSQVINIDWSIYLIFKQKKFLGRFAPLLFQGERLQRFLSIPDNILVHNLRKGIPFPTGSVDAVYHSHMLEHLDRNVADALLAEVKRVLKPGGIHRIVVPDLEVMCKAYVDHISLCGRKSSEIAHHEFYIAQLIEMSVRREAFGTSQQNPLKRFIENLLLGDARRRGETHQWMYDRINLKAKLVNLGYRKVLIQSYKKSLIPQWDVFGLDVDNEGNQYKPDSLYMEAVA